MLSRISFDKTSMINFWKKWYIYIIIFLIYTPLIFIVLLSFVGQSSRGNILDNFNQMTGENYIEIFKNNEFLNAFMNSILVSIVVVPVSLIIALVTSLGIWGSNTRIKNTFLNFTKFDIAIPDIISGVTLSVLFSLVWLSLGQNLGYFTVVVAHISFCTPYAIMAIYPRMSKFKASLIFASMDLGWSKFKTYINIVIPFLRSSIITAFVLVTTLSFDDFIITSLVNGNFSTIGTTIFESNKGIKAWIVTFGAIIVIISLTFTIIMMVRKIHVEKKGRKNEKI